MGIRNNITFIGIDNGVTGSWGIIYPNGISTFIKTPVLRTRDYTKKVQHLHRVDWRTIAKQNFISPIAIIERPMVNPRAFKATTSALRALEATLVVLEMMNIPYGYIDSKEWQREFISSEIMGHDNMKEASKEVGVELFPSHASVIVKHGDADGLLIAEYARRHPDKILRNVHT